MTQIVAGETSHEETSHEETSHKETSHKETSHKETSHKETSHKETSHKETSHKETSHEQTWSVRRLFEDMGAFTAGAAALFLLGSLLLLAAFQSPTVLQWTGTAVHDVQNDGIAYYSFHAQSYTLNVPSPAAWSSTIYLDPADPSNAIFGNPVTRWSDITLVGGPYAASILLLALGSARRSRRRRVSESADRESFGDGLDNQAIGRLLDRQRKR